MTDDERITELEARLAEANVRADKWERCFQIRCEQADQRDSEISDQFTLLDKARLEAEARAAVAERELCTEQAEHTREILLHAVTKSKLEAADATRPDCGHPFRVGDVCPTCVVADAGAEREGK